MNSFYQVQISNKLLIFECTRSSKIVAHYYFQTCVTKHSERRDSLSLFHKQKKSLKNFQKKRKKRDEKDEREKREKKRRKKKFIFQKRRRLRRRRHKIFSLSLFSRCIIRRAPQALKKTKRERSRERETTKGQKGVAF